MGWAGWGTGLALVAARVRPGKWASLSLFFSFTVLFILTLFSILQVCFEFGFETNSIYFASDNIFRS